MFKFLKRLVSGPAAPTAAPTVQRRQKPKARSSRDPFGVPAPLPEVVEGNEETDWALWEDSMTALDSQMQGLPPRTSQYDKLTPSSQADPFGSVRKRDR